MTFNRMLGGVIALLLMTGVVVSVPARAAESIKLTGAFSVAYAGYESLPLLVGLTDASGYFGKDPIYLAPAADQMLGTYTGTAADGDYQISLPDNPNARPFDITSGQVAAQSGVRVFDVRVLSDVPKRGYMSPNEDAIASSLKISVDFLVEGGTLIVWAADASQQFPIGKGADQQLFTADDPRGALPAGYSFVALDAESIKVEAAASRTLNLITTGLGDVVNYTNLSCAELIPAFLDRVQRYYPFTELHKIDWAQIRATLIPASKQAATQADCEKLIQQFGNAVPDGHVNFALPTLAAEREGALGLLLVPASDGQIVVQFVRENGPAARAGIKAGAIISAWDGKPIQQALDDLVLLFSNSGTAHGLLDVQLTQIVRGRLGSTVSITFQNPGETAVTATLTRDRPQRSTLNAAPLNLQDGRLPSGIGYIRLPSFASLGQLTGFDRELDRLISAGVPGIIIDIRSNPGGFSQISDAIASRFFDAGFTIGDTYTPDGRYVYSMRVDPRQPVYSGLVALLVDENTASAGDLFAYTFKLGKRGLIVGHTPTAGMAGTVSGGQYYLPNNAFIQIPTAGFVDAAGTLVVEGQGVAPDVLVPQTLDSILSPADEVLQAAEKALLNDQKP